MGHSILPLWLQMLSCLEYMYHDLGLVKEFNMNPITLKRWLVTSGPTVARADSVRFRGLTTRISVSQLAIQENYRNNPFHNFRHCFCVSQMMYGMIHLCNLQVGCMLPLHSRFSPSQARRSTPATRSDPLWMSHPI